MCRDGTSIFCAQQLSQRTTCFTCLQFDGDVCWALLLWAAKKQVWKGALPLQARQPFLWSYLAREKLGNAQWTDSPKELSISPEIQNNFKILPEFICTVPSPSQRTSCTPSPLPQPTRDFQFFRVISFALLLMTFLSWKHWSMKLSRVPRSRYMCYCDPVASVRTLYLGDLCGFC